MGNDTSPVTHVMPFCHGNPAAEIPTMAQAIGWNILDLTTGKWMHDTDQPEEGAIRQRAFVEKVVSGANAADPAPTGLRDLLRICPGRRG